jgi:hypothetical protein
MFFIPHGPMTKSYRYTWTVDPMDGYGTQVSDSEDVQIYVAAHKIAAGWAANAHFATAAWMTIAAATPWTCWMYVLVGIQIGCGLAQQAIAIDPVEYDPKYDEDHDHRELLLSARPTDGLLPTLRAFRDSAVEIAALTQSISVSRARHASALRDGDKARAGRQRTSARDKVARSGDAMVRLEEQLPVLMQYAADHPLVGARTTGKPESTPPTKKEWGATLSRLRRLGLNRKEKQFLRDNGLTGAMVAGLNERVRGRVPKDLEKAASERSIDVAKLAAIAEIRPATVNDIPDNATEVIADLAQKVSGFHSRTLSESSEIESTHKLTGNRLLRNLYRNDVLNRTEVEYRKNKLDSEDEYLLRA